MLPTDVIAGLVIVSGIYIGWCLFLRGVNSYLDGN